MLLVTEERYWALFYMPLVTEERFWALFYMPLVTEERNWTLFYLPLYTFVHNLLNVLMQIANKMGLRKKYNNLNIKTSLSTSESAISAMSYWTEALEPIMSVSWQWKIDPACDVIVSLFICPSVADGRHRMDVLYRHAILLWNNAKGIWQDIYNDLPAIRLPLQSVTPVVDRFRPYIQTIRATFDAEIYVLNEQG
jgi:hypothetical protein